MISIAPLRAQRAFTRASAYAPHNPLTSIVLDSPANRLLYREQILPLSACEFLIFRRLWRAGCATGNAVVSMENLIKELYSLKPDCDRPGNPTMVIRVLISRMRRMLAPLGIGIEAVRDLGTRQFLGYRVFLR